MKVKVKGYCAKCHINWINLCEDIDDINEEYYYSCHTCGIDDIKIDSFREGEESFYYNNGKVISLFTGKQKLFYKVITLMENCYIMLVPVKCPKILSIKKEIKFNNGLWAEAKYIIQEFENDAINMWIEKNEYNVMVDRSNIPEISNVYSLLLASGLQAIEIELLNKEQRRKLINEASTTDKKS